MPRPVRTCHALPVDVCVEIFSHFTLRELHAMSNWRTLEGFARKELLARLQDLYRGWGLNVVETLGTLKDTRSVMSGSGVLHLCAPGVWWPNDLDFYCPRGEKDNLVRRLEDQGYAKALRTDAPATYQGDHEYEGIPFLSDILIMRKMVGEGDAKINIIECEAPSAEAAIFTFHSTQVMNAMTADGIICFYPELTLEDRGEYRRVGEETGTHC